MKVPLHIGVLSLAVALATAMAPDSGFAASGSAGGSVKGAPRSSGGAGTVQGGPSVSPGGVGGIGSSYGPGSTSSERAGYLHGRTLLEPEPPPDDGSSDDGTPDGGTAGGTTVPQQVNNLNGCNDFVTTDTTLSARLDSSNLARFRRAESLMKKGGERAGEADYLMASYQEELNKPKPDLLLAGTYLGLVAGAPMTAATIQHISRVLCVPISHDQALGIARAAEGQRRSMQR